MGLVTHSAQGLPGVASCPRVDLPSRNRLCVISAVPCTCSVCVHVRVSLYQSCRAVVQLCGRPGSPSLVILTVSVDAKQHQNTRSCVKIEVAVLGSPTLIVLYMHVRVSLYQSCRAAVQLCGPRP